MLTRLSYRSIAVQTMTSLTGVNVIQVSFQYPCSINECLASKRLTLAKYSIIKVSGVLAMQYRPCLYS